MPLQAADMLAGFVRQQHEPSPQFIAAAAVLNGIITRVIDLNAPTLKALVAAYPEFVPGSQKQKRKHPETVTE